MSAHGITEKATANVKATVVKEVSAKKVKKKCTIELYPEKSCNIDTFRESVENFFSKKEDIIEKVIFCEVNKFRGTVRLESVVKRQIWMNFFNEPERHYSDLPVRRVLHDCQDLVNCDRVLED